MSCRCTPRLSFLLIAPLNYSPLDVVTVGVAVWRGLEYLCRFLAGKKRENSNSRRGSECKNRSPNFHRLSFVSFARNNRDKRVYKFCYDALLLDDAYSLFIIIGHCKFPLYSVIIRPTYILKVKRSLHIHPPIHLLPLEIVTRVKFEDQFSAIKRYPIEREKN